MSVYWPSLLQISIWTNAGTLLIWPIGTNFREMLIQFHIFSCETNTCQNDLSLIWPHEWNVNHNCYSRNAFEEAPLKTRVSWFGVNVLSMQLRSMQSNVWEPGPRLNIKTVLSTYGDSMLKIRRPLGRLIFNMGIAIPGKTVFLIETALRLSRLPIALYDRQISTICRQKIWLKTNSGKSLLLLFHYWFDITTASHRDQIPVMEYVAPKIYPVM